MNPVEWYYARENKQVGPVSSLELKRLATAGQLRPEDLVWREGMTEWSLASNVRGLFDGEAKPADSGLKIGEPAGAASAAAEPLAAAAPPPTAAPQAPRRHLFDALLDWLRPRLDAQRIASKAKVFRACGSYGLLAAIGLTAAFAIILVAKTGQLDHLVWGARSLVLWAVLQYVAGKSCDAIDRLGRDGGGRMASATLPDCLALTSLAAGAAALLGAVAWAIATAYYPIILFGVLTFVVLGYLAAIALNPTMLGVAVAAEVRATDEALGVLNFLARAMLRLVPVAFGAGVICGAVLLAFACGQAFSGAEGVRLAADTAEVARRCLKWFGALPLAAYLLFLLYCLLIDLCRGVLSLSGRRE